MAPSLEAIIIVAMFSRIRYAAKVLRSYCTTLRKTIIKQAM